MASFQVLDVQYLAGEALDALQKSEQEVVELYLLLDGEFADFKRTGPWSHLSNYLLKGQKYWKNVHCILLGWFSN